MRARRSSRLLARFRSWRRGNEVPPPVQWEAPGRAPSAMAGLVAGISGAVVPVIVPAVLAWWLGRSTRHEITDSQGQLSGRGFSTAAFVLAGYSLLATIALVSSAL